jgi:hypothetical protein
VRIRHQVEWSLVGAIPGMGMALVFCAVRRQEGMVGFCADREVYDSFWRAPQD